MRIKLIVPRMSLRPMDSEYKRVLSPSLALLTVAALTPAGHEVSIADENAGALNLCDTPDLVGITVNVDTSTRAYAIAAQYRERGIPVVMGGIHVSANHDEALAHADAVCIGEAENLWGQIVRDAAAGCLQQRYLGDEPADLAGTPQPRWDLIDPSRYLYTNVVCASRGCPFACEFCYNSCDYVHHRYRTRPIAHVIDEIRRLGTRQVMFIDDNFIGNVAWTLSFLQAIRPLDLKWHAAVSANVGLHPDLLDEMQATGCQSLFIGFESINQASIEGASKRQNHVDEYEELIRAIHARGIMVNASLVFGFDHDTPNVFQDTLAWLVR
ncbi:MAG: radical SAM protein, partial [Chloroflexi bacterium]|nr:radical SAM protein [Chloroflexota bacterium]